MAGDDPDAPTELPELLPEVLPEVAPFTVTGPVVLTVTGPLVLRGVVWTLECPLPRWQGAVRHPLVIRTAVRAAKARSCRMWALDAGSVQIIHPFRDITP